MLWLNSNVNCSFWHCFYLQRQATKRTREEGRVCSFPGAWTSFITLPTLQRQTVRLSVISDLFIFLPINTAAVFNGHLIPPTQASLWRRARLGLLALKCQKNICVNLKMKEPDVTKPQRYTTWYTEKIEKLWSLFSLLVKWQLPHISAVPSQMCRFPSPFLLRNCEWEQ